MFNGPERFDTRLTGFALVLAALIGGLLGFSSIRMRRLENASNLHGGLRRADLIGMVAIETGAWVAAASLVGVTVLLLLAQPIAAPDWWPTVVLAMRVPAAVAFAALMGAAVAGFVVREHHLFRYFNERR